MSAILAAAAGAGAIVVLYLLRLRRRPLWISSTMHWTSSARDLEVNVPLRMLRPSWLLLLHLLAAGALAIAIGRPAMDLSGDEPTRVVLLIDRSASMGAMDGGSSRGQAISRLETARREAVAILRGAGRGGVATVSLVTFASEARVLSGLTDDRGLIERAIGAIAQTDQPSDGLDEALDLVEAMLAEDSDESAPAARVVIISDGDLPATRERGVSGATVEFVRVGPPIGVPASPGARENVGIVALAARRLDGPEARIRLFARVANASARDRDVIAVVRADGEEIARRPVSARAGSDGSLTLDVDRSEEVLLTVRLEVEDLLASDDEASIRVGAARPTRVLLVTPSGDPERDGTWPVADVLREVPRVSVRAISAEAWGSMASAEPGTDLFADLLVLCAVDAGWMKGRALPAPVLSFGVPAPLGDGVGSIIAWEREHPLMRHVSLDGVAIGESGVFAPGDASESPVVWASAGPVLIAGERDGVRFASAAFNIDQTTWPLSFGWPLFIENAVGWLSRRDEEGSGRVWRAGESIAVPWPGTDLPVSLADGDGRTVRAEIAPALGVLRLGTLERAGVYTVVGPTDARERVPVAMLDPRESGLATSDRVSIGAAPILASVVSEMPREVWHWFVVAAAVILALEWFVFAGRARV